MNDPNDIDFTTLNWVKQELDETLRQARQALEAYVEDQSDKSQLKYCSTYMHQVQGTLRMVELYGAAMVVEEMEKVTVAIIDGDIKQTDDMLEVIMRGLVQMPDYLGRLQGGHRDIPIVLLPLLNDLRACRSEKLLTETALFSPDLGIQLPGSAAGAQVVTPTDLLRTNASKLRLAYQFGLLKWIKGDDVDGNLGRIIAILDRLRGMSAQIDARRLWWIASGVAEGVLLKALEPSVAVKLLYGKVDREIKRIVDSGEADFDRAAPNDLTKSLLYYAAHSENKGTRLAEIKSVYKLATLLPTQSEIEHANSALSGRNKALLDTVGAAIKEDIMRVKDGLDMFLRGPQSNVGDLATQGETLQRVADTLGVLGLGIPRKVVIEQRDIVTNIIVGKQAPEEQTLLDVAGALLFVESSLDDYIDRLGQGQTAQVESAATLKGLELPQAEVRRILDATMKEATINLSQAKQDIVAFIESPWDHGKIEGIPKLLEEISGALRMLNMPEPALLNDGVTRFIEVELLKHRRVPTSEQLDLMADALASIEYYLEAIREARPNRDRILEVTRRSLEALGYWPVPDPNALGTSASLDGAPSSNEFVAFPDDFQASRVEAYEIETAPVKTYAPLDRDDHPVLSLSDIPLTEAAAVAVTPESAELDLAGFVLVESAAKNTVVFADEAVSILPEDASLVSASGDSAADSAFSDFDLSMLDHESADLSAVELGEFSEFDDLLAQPDALDQPLAAEVEAIAQSESRDSETAVRQVEAVEEFSFDSLIGEEAVEAVEPVFDFSDAIPEAPIGDSAFDMASLDAFDFDPPVVIETPVVAEPIVVAPAVPIAEPLKRVDSSPFASGFQMVPSDDIDDEIREVFVEEVQDELLGLAKSFPAWKSDQNDFEKLKPVRRSFHTLKGSGRLVGALAIGEFSWKVENMLNRVLDKSIPVSPAVLACLDEAIGVLPQLLSGLKGEGNPTGNIGGIMYVADRVSAGEEIFLPKNEPAPSVELPSDVSAVSQASAGVVIHSEMDLSDLSDLAGLPEQAVESIDTSVAHVLLAEVNESAAFEPTADESPLADTADESPLADTADESPLADTAGESPLADTADYAPTGNVDELFLDLPTGDKTLNTGMPDALANDPVLVEILKSESTAHVAVMRAYVTHIDGTGRHEVVSEALLRAVHTLNGAIAMVELPFMSNVLSPLEGYLKRVKNSAGVVDDRGLDALSSTCDLVEKMIAGIERGDVLGLNSSELEHLVLGLRDNLPEAEQLHVETHHAMMDELDEEEAGALSLESTGSDAESRRKATRQIESPLADTADESRRTGDTADEPRRTGGTADESRRTGDTADESRRTGDTADETHTNSAEALDEVELFAFADLSDYEKSPLADTVDESPLADTVDDSEGQNDAPQNSEFLSERSDKLVADLARLEEQAFAPIEDASAPIEVDAELLDLVYLDEPEKAKFAADVGLAQDVFADLSFLEIAESSDAFSPIESNLSADLNVSQHEQELIALDDLAADDLLGEFLSIEPNLAEDDVFADLGLFDDLSEIEIPTPAFDSANREAADLDLDRLDLDAFDQVGVEEPKFAAVIEALAPKEPQIDQNVVSENDAFELFSADAGLDALMFSDTAESSSLTDLDAVFDAVADVTPSGDSANFALADTAGELDSFEFADSEIAALDLEKNFERTQPTLADSVFATAPSSGTQSQSSAQWVLPISPDIDPDGPLLLADPDEELLEIFVQEGVDILDTADNMMARLRETPNDFEIVVGLQRELHTLKGGARMAGVNAIGDLSHSLESLFEAIVDKRANNSAVTMEALERSFDRMHQMVTRVGKRLAVGQPVNIIARLDALLDGDDDQFFVAPTVVSESTVDPISVIAPESAPIAPALSKPAALAPKQVDAKPQPERVERKTALDEDDGGQRQQQESIRVRADLIDNLVNYAGEVSIYRSRLEAQIGGFRFNLQEFDQTVLRLREQLRKLEMETEAQILSRYQREETKKDIGFDPLELDRFSTLQQLSRALAESVSDLVSLQSLMDDIARQSETLLLQQSRVSTELQEGLMRTRMVPFDSLVPRLRRIMRQTGGELGKRAALKVEGAQGEMDRTVMDRMTAPLEHMLRNALAHGLELPQVRRAAGKPEEGTVTVSVSREATEVVIKVTDDGRGMDRDAIRAKAIERGLLRADAQLSDRDLFQFVLEAGFSTAETVSKIAGRGVGMDVVNSEIKQLGGSLQIDSVKGVGSVFSVRLPFTLSVTQAILIKLADTPFAVPLSSVQGVMRMPRKELDRRILSNDLEVTYAGETYQIYDLGELIRQPIAYAKDESQVPLVMTKSGDQRAAVRVSQVVGSKEVVVKAVGAQLSSVPGFFGATIMGDGSVIVILDLAPLVRHGAALRQSPELAAELDLDVVVTSPVETRRQKLVMVVDDSITMRKVTTRVLERNDMEVITAKDGLDAVEQLQDRVPDLMLLDIEMPRMDGYELATYVKNDSRLKHIPIIMITSRTGEKHRQRAMEIGVERYLGKPYQEVDLLKNVMESLNGVIAK